jgi:starch synthase
VRLHLVDGRDPVVRQKCWSAADFFTSLSDNIQETFGLTPVEAMAAGLPVVITDWNGYRDTLEDGVQGIAIPTLAPPPGSGDDIAARYRSTRYSYGGYIGRTAQFTYVDAGLAGDAYTKLIESDDLRKTMGAAGRKRALGTYDWSVIIPQYEALWAELAERRTKDDEVAAPGNKHAADPLRDDPFRSFAGYPSATISEDHIIERIAPDAELEKLIQFDIKSAVAGLVPDAPGMRALLAILPQPGKTLSVGAVLKTSDAPRIQVMRATLWLSKLGIIRLTGGQG